MLVDYLMKEVMTFRVYGYADCKLKEKKDNARKPVKKPIQNVNTSTLSGDQSTDVSTSAANVSVTGTSVAGSQVR